VTFGRVHKRQPLPETRPGRCRRHQEDPHAEGRPALTGGRWHDAARALSWWRGHKHRNSGGVAGAYDPVPKNPGFPRKLSLPCARLLRAPGEYPEQSSGSERCLREAAETTLPTSCAGDGVITSAGIQQTIAPPLCVDRQCDG
jgi:hypothetical protein